MPFHSVQTNCCLAFFPKDSLDVQLCILAIVPHIPLSHPVLAFPQFLDQATSMDGLKKSDGYAGSLLEHFHAAYGSADSAGFKKAQQNFLCSLAGFVCQKFVSSRV